jgi:hypothetical protein
MERKMTKTSRNINEREQGDLERIRHIQGPEQALQPKSRIFMPHGA